MEPLVSAIVLNYRCGRLAWTCVEALLRQSIADQLEILVVDNHSEDDSIGYLRNHAAGAAARVHILETSRNLGYGQGNTLGVRRARGEYILIINPDNELEPRGLELLVAEISRDPSIGIVAPKLVQEDGSVRESFRTFPTLADLFIKRSPMLRRFFPERMRRYLQTDRETIRMRQVDWVAGACFLMRRSLFLELGGFDPRFFLFFEDTDLCRRCRDVGKKVVYLPSVQARDRKRRLSEGGVFALFTKKTARIHLLSALKYFWKWRFSRH